MQPEIFEYSSPINLFERLNRQFDKLNEYPIDKDHALDFCLTAWSLADWVFYERHPAGTEREKGLFRINELFNRCDDLKIMRDIANGIKHFKLSTRKSDFKSIETKESTFDHTFDFTFGPSIIIKFDSGDELILNEIIDTVFTFWKEFLHP